MIKRFFPVVMVLLLAPVGEAEDWLVKVVDGEEFRLLGYQRSASTFESCEGHSYEIAEGDRVEKAMNGERCPPPDDKGDPPGPNAEQDEEKPDSDAARVEPPK